MSDTATRPGDGLGPGAADHDAAPLSVRIVDRFGRALAGRGLSRRRFLGRTAIAASALTVNPLQYVLRPTSAYASVCGEGASCSSGWTAFCCTVNDGANTCPSGSYAAGWWKIDSSPFCRDAPRYIVDCNRRPSASCSCHCADGPCDRRRVCCNNFRYGQCNTQISGVTEVVCRVVTCAPPWEWDPACSRTVRTDNRTRSHNATCLPGANPSAIEIRYQDLGMVGSVLGAPTTPERDAARSGRYRRYDAGSMYWHSGTGAHYVLGSLDRAYRNLGGTAGDLGYPRSDPRDAPGGGQQVRFEHGTIYLHDQTGAHGVMGPSDVRYRQLDGAGGVLGRPTGSTRDASGGWRTTRFEHGWIHQSPGGGPAELHGPILARWSDLGGAQGSGLGYAIDAPRTRSGALVQHFEDGLIAGPEGGDVRAVRGRIARRYVELGLAGSDWGTPVADQRAIAGGQVAEFTRVTVYDSTATGPRALSGAVLERYLEEDGPEGWLGFPTTDATVDRTGQLRATFEHGAILADRDTGDTRTLDRRATRSRSEVPTPSGGGARRETRNAEEAQP
jgi:hypothetical protein